MKRFEYDAVYLAGPLHSRMDATSVLNAMGEDGWQVVAVEQVPETASVVWFMRELSPAGNPL